MVLHVTSEVMVCCVYSFAVNMYTQYSQPFHIQDLQHLREGPLNPFCKWRAAQIVGIYRGEERSIHGRPARGYWQDTQYVEGSFSWEIQQMEAQLLCHHGPPGLLDKGFIVDHASMKISSVIKWEEHRNSWSSWNPCSPPFCFYSTI